MESHEGERPLPVGCETRDFFRFAVAGALDSVVVTTADLENPEPVIVYVNAAFERMTGYSAQEAIGQSPRMLQGPRTDQRVLARLKADLLAGREFRGSTANYRKDGGEYQVEWRVSGVYDEGRLVNWMAIQRDVTDKWRIEREAERIRQELAEANARLEALATTDGLTGLLNARAFHDRLREECARALRHGRSLSLVLLDVDRFKAYNDDFGHPAGDEALRRVGETLRGQTRGYDVAARYGGEEFALLLPNTSGHEATLVADRARRAVADQDWPLRGVTVSAGVAELPRHTEAAEALLEAADRALYVAKSSGRDRIVLTEWEDR